jgi:hypothetical protein
MTALKFIAAAAIFSAASLAFAGTDDGNVGPAWQLQSTVSSQTAATRNAAPAPTAAAASAKQATNKSAQGNFVRQLSEGSDGGQE